MLNDIIDCHVHTAPSLMPRRHTDGEILTIARQAGVGTVVLKAHEGSTVERALLLGGGAMGGVVLNSPVGGANPEEGPSPTEYFLTRYPRELLVFGSDLGHQAFPDYVSGVRDWISELDKKLESSALEAVLIDNPKELLGK